MNIRGMNTFWERGEHGHCGVTNFGSITYFGQGVLNDVVIVVVSDESILISPTGSDGISAC